MTKEEYHARKAKQEHAREVERASHKAAKGPLDLPFLLMVLLLTGIGLIMMFSASFPSAYYETGDAAYYFKRQLIFAALGIAAMIVLGKINYARWRGISRIALFAAIMLLILVVIPGVGITRNNATRWLGVGELLTFQPSEIAKLAMVLYFADSISKKKEKMLTFREGVLPYMIYLIIFAILMMLEPHLSGTVIIVVTGAVMMVLGGIRGWLIALGLGGAGIGAVAYVKLVEKGIIHYGAGRILLWHDPWQDFLNDGWQPAQCLISIGSGGLWGVGLGKSRQKFLYLPEESNDCIFAIVCEELGLIGACVIMILFAVLIIRGFWIALHARDRFGALLTAGIMTQIGLQTFLNIAVVSGLVPNTGVSLPFFSYGGTALALQLAEMGLVLSVSRQIGAPKAG